MPPPSPRFSDAEIMRRIDACPKLASLQSINRALAGLVSAEQSFNSQIAEIIRRAAPLRAMVIAHREELIFQAKDAQIQEFYIRSFGPEVSLDIEDDQAVALELLRIGLRKSALAGLTRTEGTQEKAR
jgi:phosphosulfolactate synthase (CoM biosynthesis protein A)